MHQFYQSVSKREQLRMNTPLSRIEIEIHNVLCGLVLVEAMSSFRGREQSLAQHLTEFTRCHYYLTRECHERIAEISGNEVHPDNIGQAAINMSSDIATTYDTMAFVTIQLNIHAAASDAGVEFTTDDLYTDSFTHQSLMLTSALVRQSVNNLLWCRSHVYTKNDVTFCNTLRSRIVALYCKFLPDRESAESMINEAINTWLESECTLHVIGTHDSQWPGAPTVLLELNSTCAVSG